MAKKAANTPRHTSKKAPQHIKNAREAKRSYSLDDILGEYRLPPEDTRKISPVTPPGEQSTRQRMHEAITALGENMRAESKVGEKHLPEKEAMPDRSGEERKVRRKKSDKGKHAAGEKKRESVSEGKETDETAKVSPTREKYRVGGESRNPFRRLYGWFLGQAAAIAIKRKLKTLQEQETEQPGREPTPLEAAKIYAAQIPAFLRRSRSAALFSLLCVWIALAWGADIPIPGALGTDIRTATLVSLILLLTVMLMGLDVLTVGIFSAIGKKPGFETLLSVSCLASVIDCVFVVVNKDSSAPLPPCAVCCVGIALALRGSWYRCRNLKSAFLTLHKNKNAYTVNGEKLPSREGKFIIKSRRSTAGFIRSSEESDVCEQIGQLMTPFVLFLVILLSALSGIGSDYSSLPHSFAVLASLGCCWSGLLVLPMLISPVNERLGKLGAALGGWKAVEELGGCQHLIITDSDLFPEGTTAFYSVRILNAEDTEQVISRTGSIVAAAGTELARLFADLMERSGARMVPVTGFIPQDGGATGIIDGVEVHVGNAGYMYFMGIKIDPVLAGETVIYTAYEQQLVGAFGVEYTPDEKVAAALRTLQRSGQKPVFAPRDYNIHPQLVERLFRCKTDGFEFPDIEGRKQLNARADESTAVPAALISSGGLEVITDIFDASRRLSRCGRILRVLCIVSTVLGLLLGFVFCLSGAWEVVSCTRLLLYMLFWLLPGLVMSVKSGV